MALAPCIDQACIPRLPCPGASGIVGPSPSFPFVKEISQNIELFLPPRRERVEGLAGAQFHAWNYKVQFMVAGVVMSHPKNIVGICR